MVCRAVQRLRHNEKILSTYLIPLLEEHADAADLIHPSYTVGGTVTYRLSSSNPNGQNMPRELTSVLWTPYLSADYSQAELRLAAAYAQEPALAQAFNQGLDVHLDTARRMFGDEQARAKRKVAKNINFATLYGGSAKTLHIRYDIPLHEAYEFVRLHRKIYPALHRATRTAQEVWAQRGYLKLITGKRIYATPDDLERGYKAFNNIIQGGVGELVKEAMLALDAQGIPMIGQVHDAIEFPVDADRAAIAAVMDNILPEPIATRTHPPIRMQIDFETKGSDL
jgi:DNA polymerase-1